jgi:hypothetical protein
VQRLKRLARHVLNSLVTLGSPLLVPVFASQAKTGIGSNVWLKWGLLPLPVHFYSPVPDYADLEKRLVWDRRSKLAGIDFCTEAQLALMAKLGRRYGAECDWPLHPTGNPYEFAVDNPEASFSYGCAASLHCILRNFRPTRVIEVGSGNSSFVIAAALQRNKSEGQPSVEYTIVDPYPREVICQGLPMLSRLVQERVECLDPSLFEQLSENDVLFVDSGHTVRIGGDVNYLILDVLPRLAPGVIVHFHDIPLPYEYSKAYATNPTFRMLWTESYLLQAFLACNAEFEILLAMAYLMAEHQQAFRTAFPHYDPQTHRAGSGSFWIRRKPVAKERDA